MTDIIDAPVLRDSGYSESLHSASYEEFVLPSMDTDKTPPPLPPKNTQSQSNLESNGKKKNCLRIYVYLYFKINIKIICFFKDLLIMENYSVPGGMMRHLESSP